jgi:Uma2 family endonuclease
MPDNVTAASHSVHYGFAEYLALEAASNVKHEYLGGQIYAMAGGSPEHAALAVAVSASLFAALQGKGCRVYNSDLRVRVLATGLATYPDVTIVCGSLELDPEDRHTIVNPVVLVEVTSPSTEQYDRSGKFEHYQQIESLREYVLISHGRRSIEIRRRSGQEWITLEAGAGERATLSSIACELDVDALYMAVR